MTRVLYIGSGSGTSLQRIQALRRLGHHVFHVDPYVDLPRFWPLWLYRAGGIGIDGLVARWLRKRLSGFTFPICIVNVGEIIGPSAMREIRRVSDVVANYVSDNPFLTPPVERRRWSIVRRTAHLYDLNYITSRPGIDDQMRAFGVTRPRPVWACADEEVHRYADLSDDDRRRYGNDVVFVGTWMPGRGAFVQSLRARGVNLRVFGTGWSKAPEYGDIKEIVSQGHLAESEYSKAISGAKIAIALLNGTNQDLHTKRSVEIPAIGTLMCAQRTSDHLELYREGEEAFFFDTVDECAELCRKLLADDGLRERVAKAGRLRALRNGNFNENLMARMVSEALALSVADNATVKDGGLDVVDVPLAQVMS